MQRRQQLHVPTRERYKENIPTYRRNRITLKSTRKYKCPNSTCRKTFASTVHVLQHLNHPRSSCYKWSQEAEYSIFGGREGAEQYLNGSRDVSNGPGPLASTSSAQSSCTEVPNAPTSPASPREELLPFPGAAQSVAGGTSFMNWMDEDVFAAQRTDNYYYPFANGDEWDFGRFLTTSSLRMREIDEFLKLPIVQKHLLPHLTFKSAKELRQRVELLPTGPRWVAQTIKYPGFPTKRPIVLFYRNSLDCAQLILRHPVLKKHIDLIPTLLTQGGERIHKEWINSDSAWQMQQAIPAGRTVLGIVASSDKTNISVMNGDRVAHPFLLSLANLHSEVASKASSNAFIMTALLPVPKFLCEKKLRGIMEKRLLHQCLDIICGPLKLAARDGAPLSTSDGGIIVAHTPLVSYIVDTPEAADLSGVKGKTSHLTMASHKTFGDAVRQPERTGASTWEAICSVTARVSPDDVAAYQKAAKAHPNRLSGVHLPFWRDWPLSTDPSKFLTPEVLHHIHKAFFDHDFQWGRTILGDAEIDFRLSLYIRARARAISTTA
ncbi:RPN1-RPN2-N domain-containing protein [Mycena kentingensis (nom. inval.)]|nr:RPN1-RPN2-N domain-containing protein [Mycena kentingensis (nom. inval.)]